MIGPIQRPLPDNTQHSQETLSRCMFYFQLKYHLDFYASGWNTSEEPKVFDAIITYIVHLVAILKSAAFSFNN